MFIGGCIVYHHEITGEYLGFAPGFQQYVQNRYPMQTDHNWAGIIRFFCSSNEEAFDTFYELLLEFRKQDGEGEKER